MSVVFITESGNKNFQLAWVATALPSDKVPELVSPEDAVNVPIVVPFINNVATNLESYDRFTFICVVVE